jgi:hypothetical protein
MGGVELLVDEADQAQAEEVLGSSMYIVDPGT